MNRAFEIIGTFIVSLLFIFIPILCTLSFVYNWFAGIKFLLIVTCLIEWSAVITLLVEIADEQD